MRSNLTLSRTIRRKNKKQKNKKQPSFFRDGFLLREAMFASQVMCLWRDVLKSKAMFLVLREDKVKIIYVFAKNITV